MVRNVIVDAGFLVALLSGADAHHEWAVSCVSEFPLPWGTCEAALSEAFHLLGEHGERSLGALLRRRAVRIPFSLRENFESVLKSIDKYSNLPMGLADACLVRMTEILARPVVLTTDRDFRIYRRHDRQIVPCVTP